MSLAVCVLLSLARPTEPPAAAEPAPAPAELAKGAAEAFMKGFQLLNLDDIMQVVDTPWHHDGKTVIHDRKELEADFVRLLERYRRTQKMKYELRKQETYGVVRGQLEPAQRKLVDQVLTERDFVQLVQLTNPETGKKETVVLFIRVKDKAAKVVGLEN